jgi:hypothetical protein
MHDPNRQQSTRRDWSPAADPHPFFEPWDECCHQDCRAAHGYCRNCRVWRSHDSSERAARFVDFSLGVHESRRPERQEG